MDGIPVFSQAKSFIQLVCGQTESALETQRNFSRQCPIVSQIRSLVEVVILDDEEAAIETQKECGHFVGGLVNGIPVVGHGKGLIHYAFDDYEGGHAAMKASSHTTAVAAGGVAGFFVGGPVGAAAAGIAAGAAMDCTITIADTEINGTKDGKVRTFGILEPLSDPTDAGKWFDAGCGVVLDGLAARSTGKLAGKVSHKVRGMNAGRSASTIVGESSMEGAGRRRSAVVGESSIEGAGRRRSAVVGENSMEGAGRRRSAVVGENSMEGAGRRRSAVVGENSMEGAGRRAIVEESINESSGGNAPTNVVQSVLVRTRWPSQVTVSPNMTVLMMVRNECFYFFRAKVIGKAHIIILQDLLTDVGPMVVRCLYVRPYIRFLCGLCFFNDDSSNTFKLENDHVYTLSPEGFLEDLDCSDAMNRWTMFWNNPKRVALLKYFLEQI